MLFSSFSLATIVISSARAASSGFLAASKTGDGECGCAQGGEWTCTCIQFCDCPGEDCDLNGQGNTGCNHLVSRAYYLKTDGSGNTGCDSDWVFEADGGLIQYNWIYFWIPGEDSDPSVVLSPYGSTDGGSESQLGAYCTGMPVDGQRFESTNNGGNGYNLKNYYYIRSVRVDKLLMSSLNTAQSEPAKVERTNMTNAVDAVGSFAEAGGDNGMFGLKIMLWPEHDMKPYDEISCLKGDPTTESAPINYDVPATFPMDVCTKCYGCSCQDLKPRCVSAIDRTYCFSLNDVWGAGQWDDLKEYGYDYGDGAIIKWNFPMLSAITDRYTDTFHEGSGPGAGKFCNPNAARNPNPGTCVLTRFYGVGCGEASWPKPSSGAAADGAAEYVLGCGTTKSGELRCGGPGQGWATYFNAAETYWVQCLMTRVVDDSDADCKFRLER